MLHSPEGLVTHHATEVSFTVSLVSVIPEGLLGGELLGTKVAGEDDLWLLLVFPWLPPPPQGPVGAQGPPSRAPLVVGPVGVAEQVGAGGLGAAPLFIVLRKLVSLQVPPSPKYPVAFAAGVLSLHLHLRSLFLVGLSVLAEV